MCMRKYRLEARLCNRLHCKNAIICMLFCSEKQKPLTFALANEKNLSKFCKNKIS